MVAWGVFQNCDYESWYLGQVLCKFTKFFAASERNLASGSANAVHKREYGQNVERILESVEGGARFVID